MSMLAAASTAWPSSRSRAGDSTSRASLKPAFRNRRSVSLSTLSAGSVRAELSSPATITGRPERISASARSMEIIPESQKSTFKETSVTLMVSIRGCCDGAPLRRKRGNLHQSPANGRRRSSRISTET